MPMSFGRFVCNGRGQRDRLGETVGPYVVIAYVGDNPKGEYVRIACPDCGHEIPPQSRGHISTKAKCCAKCGRLAQPKVGPKRVLDDAAQ